MPDDSPETVRAKQAARMKCYMDETVDPCQKFYAYACGSWEKYHPIPRSNKGLVEDTDAFAHFLPLPPEGHDFYMANLT